MTSEVAPCHLQSVSENVYSAWLQKADESLLEETYSWLNGDSSTCELAKVLAKPLKSSQLELENMTRDRDFEIDPEWRKQPWMKNFPKKYNLNK